MKGGVSDYIRGLRQKIGRDLLLTPAVGGIVLDEQGRILFQQRTDNGEWHPPGGAIDPLEAPVDAVVREVWEETGLWVEPTRISGIYNSPELDITYPNGDRVAIYSLVFVCRVVGGQLRPDGFESLAVAFFKPEELTEEFLPLRWRRRLADALNNRTDAYFKLPTWQPPG